MFGDVTLPLPAVTERAGARTMGWVEVGPPPATMNAITITIIYQIVMLFAFTKDHKKNWSIITVGRFPYFVLQFL